MGALSAVAADATAERIRRARPTGFPALEGYRGAIEAYLAVGELARARTVVRALTSFARMFPIARPSLLFFRAELDWRMLVLVLADSIALVFLGTLMYWLLEVRGLGSLLGLAVLAAVPL